MKIQHTQSRALPHPIVTTTLAQTRHNTIIINIIIKKNNKSQTQRMKQKKKKTLALTFPAKFRRALAHIRKRRRDAAKYRAHTHTHANTLAHTIWCVECVGVCVCKCCKCGVQRAIYNLIIVSQRSFIYLWFERHTPYVNALTINVSRNNFRPPARTNISLRLHLDNYIIFTKKNVFLQSGLKKYILFYNNKKSLKSFDQSREKMYLDPSNSHSKL